MGEAGKPKKPKLYGFKIHQDGMVVAAGDGPDKNAIRREAMHYAMMYAQDGEVMLEPIGWRIERPTATAPRGD